MRFLAAADTDTGISKSNNQDSVLIKHAKYFDDEILLAVVCDGMGGLSKGEVASAAVIRAFSKWFDEELPNELAGYDMQVIGNAWSLILKELNGKIREYGSNINVSMGTTFTGILFINSEYVIVHVGDCRVYFMNNSLSILTQDQTFVAREIAHGRMTEYQAETDPRRNILLQCIGASPAVEPQIITGLSQEGIYLLCSDGFRHVNTPKEIYEAYSSTYISDRDQMHRINVALIEQAKSRGERDNISVILIKAQ